MAKELPTIYLAVGLPTEEHPKGDRAIISITYTAGGAIARRQYSGDIVGRAGGGGYDLTSTCLAEALTRIYGIPLTDGACGESHVVDHARREGVRVYRLGEALYALPEMLPQEMDDRHAVSNGRGQR